MSGSDNLGSENVQPPIKKAKSHYDTLSSHHTQQSSQWLENIIIETGHHQDQLNTRHTINVIRNNKKECQKRYREQNREKLRQREAERRKRIQYSKSIARLSTSSNTNILEVNNEEIITAPKKKKRDITLNLDGFKFVVVEIDRRIEVVQKGWTPPEGAEYVKPHAIFDSYKSASDYAETINVKKTPRVAPAVVSPSPDVVSIDADSSNCPEPNTQEVRTVVKPPLPTKSSNLVKRKLHQVRAASASTSTPSPGGAAPKRIIGTLVKKNAGQSIRVTSANGLDNVVKTKRFIGTLVNKNITKNPTVSKKQNLDSQNPKSGNVIIVVEKVDDSPNVITGDVPGNSNPPMQIDTKDPTLTSTMSDSNSLEGATTKENLGIKDDLAIKEEFINEEFIEEEELMVVDPLAI